MVQAIVVMKKQRAVVVCPSLVSESYLPACILSCLVPHPRSFCSVPFCMPFVLAIGLDLVASSTYLFLAICLPFVHFTAFAIW